VHGGAGADDARLTNRGLLLYREFNEVVVLTTCHRVTLDVQHLQGAEAEAYRARAQRFVELLHKVRDLTLTPADYFELCKRKRAFLSLRERQAFDQAPVMMDFRKDTASTADGNCELYNRRQVRALARRQRVPVIAWDASHEGVRHEDASSLDDERFNQLAGRLELCVGARVLLVHNLHVPTGLLNGAQGVVVDIIFLHDTNPNHERRACRMPQCVIVDFPFYEGPPFFSDAARRTWVPILPRTVTDDVQRDVSRTQILLILAWAITPWKAQGMTLRRAVVNLGKAAQKPGVLFVALSRVRHPDDLMLDDSFRLPATAAGAPKQGFQTAATVGETAPR